LFLVSLLLFSSCAGGESEAGGTPGIDLENQVVHVGIINDLSGPAASIGRPLQTGLEILYREINAGGSGLLPEGWTVEWVTRDHGYNPQQSVQMYNEISEDVLYLALSMGSSMTLPLHPMLTRDHMMAIPASLSSRTAQNEHTPVITPTYRTEGMRAVDWAVEQRGPEVKLGIVYQQDDYGADALEGFEVEAEFQGVEIVSAQAVAPGQADYTAIVTALQSAGAEYVMVGILPSGTGPFWGPRRSWDMSRSGWGPPPPGWTPSSTRRSFLPRSSPTITWWAARGTGARTSRVWRALSRPTRPTGKARPRTATS
jgi:ABC-type branched-subunit amino acid transport system substrate-binding protein